MSDISLISLFILFTSLFISTSYPYWAGIPTVIILITIYFVTNPRSKKFYIFGSLFFLFFWFINYLETTLGLIVNLEESSRSLRECCASSVNSNLSVAAMAGFPTMHMVFLLKMFH